MLVGHMRGPFDFKMFVHKTTLLGHFISIGTKSSSFIMKEVVQGGLVVHTCAHSPLPFLSNTAGMVNINYLIGSNYVDELEGTLIQIEKILVNDCLTVLNES